MMKNRERKNARTKSCWKTLVLGSCLVVLLPAGAGALTVPPNDGFVTDEAGVLTQEQQQALEDRLGVYREETSNEIAILILRSLGGEALADAAVDV
ncbi:MAG: TPM domain-containing protein, partial [Candidatus Peribacteraceae bacterium]